MDILKQFEEKINGTLETFDRIIINGYFQQLHSFRLFLIISFRKRFCSKTLILSLHNSMALLRKIILPFHLSVCYNKKKDVKAYRRVHGE